MHQKARPRFPKHLLEMTTSVKVTRKESVQSSQRTKSHACGCSTHVLKGTRSESAYRPKATGFRRTTFENMSCRNSINIQISRTLGICTEVEGSKTHTSASSNMFCRCSTTFLKFTSSDFVRKAWSAPLAMRRACTYSIRWFGIPDVLRSCSMREVASKFDQMSWHS